MKSKVKWFDDMKGYGFLHGVEGGPPIFIHYCVIQGEGFKTLEEGEEVEFDLIQGPKGPLAANAVRVTKNVTP